MSDLLFAAPWWLIGSMVIIGAIVCWSGLTKQQAGTRNVGAGLIGLAVVLFLLGYFVVTDKEKVTRDTLDLVKSVQDRDWSKFASLLDANVTLDSPGGTLYTGRDDLTKGAKTKSEQYSLSAISAHIEQIEQDNAGIVVDVDCTSRQSILGMDYPVPSSWKMNWQKAGNEWQLHQISCLSIGREPSGQISHWVGK